MSVPPGFRSSTARAPQPDPCRLRAAGIVVVEVDRPRRDGRCPHVVPKAGDGIVEAIRALRVSRRGAVKARTATINQLKGLLVTAPPEIR